MTPDYDFAIQFGCAVAEAYAKHEQVEGAVAEVARTFPEVSPETITLAWRAIDAHQIRGWGAIGALPPKATTIRPEEAS